MFESSIAQYPPVVGGGGFSPALYPVKPTTASLHRVPPAVGAGTYM